MSNGSQSAQYDRDRSAFYERADTQNLAPLWMRLKALVPKSPTPVASVHQWSYESVRPFILESAGLISAKEAERRVLILENPALAGSSQITGTLYAGLQLLMPNELAPAHRHTQSALRFVIEGKGAYTAVDGEQTFMQPGDFVITPSWTWHHHGNDTSEPMIWLDGLDIPLAMYFGATFREEHPREQAQITRPAGDSLARFGSGLLPVSAQRPAHTSPVFSYPYDRTRSALFALTRAGDPDSHHGHLLRYANPIDGGWAMPTMSTMIRLLPGGFETRPYRSTDSAVFVAVEGSGAIEVSGKQYTLKPHDVVVIPGWTTYSCRATSDLVLFSFSDRVAQEKLGLFREERSGH